MSCKKCCEKVKEALEDFLFNYDSPRMVVIRSKKVGTAHFIFQLAILGYVIGYSIIYRKAYQTTGDLIGSARMKVKGVAFTNASEVPGMSGPVMDSTDYTYPAQDGTGFFIRTNTIITDNQKQGKCPESPRVLHARCKKDSDCPKHQPVALGHGVRTGKCVTSDQNHKIKVCEIYAWCPVEKDKLDPRLYERPLLDPSNFTVLIKSHIMFPKYGVKRRNILTKDKKYIRSCHFDPVSDPYCPIFRIGKIVKLSGSNMTKLAIKGGVIGIEIIWKCNLDLGNDACRPKYRFQRLDDPHTAIGKGWNFRYGHYYNDRGTKKRTLIKAYGIRFEVIQEGEAGKFDIVELGLNLGSGVGLLAFASVLSEMLVLKVLKYKDYYKKKKYTEIEENTAMAEEMKEQPSYSGEKE